MLRDRSKCLWPAYAYKLFQVANDFGVFEVARVQLIPLISLIPAIMHYVLTKFALRPLILHETWTLNQTNSQPTRGLHHIPLPLH